MSEERYNEIQDFLDGKFTDVQREEFRSTISTDETLAADVAFVRLEREMQDALLDDELLAQMKEWQKEKDDLPDLPHNDFPTKKNGHKHWWLLLLLPLLIAWAWWALDESPPPVPATSGEAKKNMPEPLQQNEATAPVEKQPTKPKEEEPQPPPPRQERPIAKTASSDAELLAMIDEHDFQLGYLPLETRGAADDLTRAETARKAGRYDEAILLYKKVAEGQSDKALEAAMNLGLLFFNLEKYQEAAPYFKKMAESTYADDAQYYLALCYVADRKFGDAIALIENLIERDGFINDADRRKAEGLLKKLQEIR